MVSVLTRIAARPLRCRKVTLVVVLVLPVPNVAAREAPRIDPVALRLAHEQVLGVVAQHRPPVHVTCVSNSNVIFNGEAARTNHLPPLAPVVHPHGCIPLGPRHGFVTIHLVTLGGAVVDSHPHLEGLKVRFSHGVVQDLDLDVFAPLPAEECQLPVALLKIKARSSSSGDRAVLQDDLSEISMRSLDLQVRGAGPFRGVVDVAGELEQATPLVRDDPHGATGGAVACTQHLDGLQVHHGGGRLDPARRVAAVDHRRGVIYLLRKLFH
mmetsp:Transcript_24578/g.46184  ORF Transcript_24578/g.46184 Transcript_24578/m.46184 type:complete len:268 (+) Transcript_24578:1288-2091(+)